MLMQVHHLHCLQTLEELTITLQDSSWNHSHLRTLGALALPQLHTLRLLNRAEDVFGQDPADPNCKWSNSDDDGEYSPEFPPVPRAKFAELHITEQNCSLLQLPALTRLTLPYVSSDSVELMRVLFKHAGRTLCVDRCIPQSRKHEFDRRFVERGPLYTLLDRFS
jgi:hypothetical protein